MRVRLFSPFVRRTGPSKNRVWCGFCRTGPRVHSGTACPFTPCAEHGIKHSARMKWREDGNSPNMWPSIQMTMWTYPLYEYEWVLQCMGIAELSSSRGLRFPRIKFIIIIIIYEYASRRKKRKHPVLSPESKRIWCKHIKQLIFHHIKDKTSCGWMGFDWLTLRK